MIFEEFNSELLIIKLHITQCGLRNVDQLADMRNYVRCQGFFTEEALQAYSEQTGRYKAPLIKIALFEDGKMYIEDGHHRCISIYQGGRHYLRPDEYRVKVWKYSDFSDINFDEGWVTPYDPRVECRYADLREFKKQVKDNLKISEDHTIRFITNNPDKYKCLRRYNPITGIIEELNLRG